MRALLLGSYGTRPSTFLGEQPKVEPGPNELRVRIEAAAFSPLDSKIATGAMKDWFPISFPYVPGTDFAGVVEAVGSGITDITLGEAVFGRANPVAGGAFATHIVVPAELVAHRPSTVMASVAACLPTPAGVALQGIAVLERKGDEPFLILGDGAVAHAAKAIGGSAATIAASEDEIEAAPTVHFALDAVGGALQQAVLRRLPRGSRIVAIVSPVEQEAATRLGLDAQYAVLETSRGQLQDLARLASEGVLAPQPTRVIGLNEAPASFDRYVARELSGKILITGDRT